MSDHPIIATLHGFEAVEAVVQYAEDGSRALDVVKFIMGGNWRTESANGPDGDGVIWSSMFDEASPGQWLVRHLDGSITVHDTDPRIEPTEKVHPVFPEGWHRFSECHTMTWTVGKEPKDTRYCTRPRDHEGSCGDWFHEDTLPRKRQLSYPVTLAGKPFTLVGEWVEVADA